MRRAAQRNLQVCRVRKLSGNYGMEMVELKYLQSESGMRQANLLDW